MTFSRIIAAFLIFSFASGASRAEDLLPDSALQAAALHASTAPIAPTATVEMGDVGGKFFGQVPAPAHTRHYYIAAEVDAWDFAPKLTDPVCGQPIPPRLAEHHVAMKLRYFQYTDATFTARVLPEPRLGLLGPVLRGVTGDTLAVTFLNRTELPLSMHPHGVKYDKDSEGAYYQPGPGLGAAVAPGAKFTYVWLLDEQSGPLPGEPSSKGWLYHSHVHGDEEANLGLVGGIIVTDPKRARPDGTPNDVDREMATLFMIFNESGFSEADEEALETAGANAPEQTPAQIQDQREQGSRYAINGYIFGNLPGLEMNEGERVRWYLFGLGDENDNHTAHWHGLRVVEDGRRRTDVVELLPATMKVADLVADNPGTWLFHCHVAEHMQEGMFTRLLVHPKADATRAPGPAFLGTREAEQSLRITYAESSLDSEKHYRSQLRGTVTVPSAFQAFQHPIRIQISGTSVTFHPGTDGKATAEGNSLRLTNADPYGVVYGEQMNFEVNLTGLNWLLALSHGNPNSPPLSLQLTIGETHHTATIPIPKAEPK